MTEFAKTLKRILDERGISQKWLADAADTKEATISRYVTGVNKSPNVEILANIAKALNISTDYLLGLTDIPRYKSDTTAEERVFLSAFRKATERDVAVLWQLLDPYITPSEREFLSHLEKNGSAKKTN
ncbi:MAG: helix-turn-helix domain-containing protein [Acutalibacteraceae bacterium]